MSQVVTGEAVALDLRVARLGSRSVAAAIDLAVETVLVWLLFAALGKLRIGFDSNLAAAVAILVFVLFNVGYPVAFETLWRGRTPGKVALGLRVVRDDGGPVRFRHALVRGVLNLLERPGITLGVVAVVTSLASRRGKRVGDLLAGTMVLQERVPVRRLGPVSMPPPLAGWARGLDLSRLPDGLALAARDFLGRADQLRPDARERLGGQLVAAVAATVAPPPPPGTPGWAYLAAVLSERRRRDEARLAADRGAAAAPPGAPAAPRLPLPAAPPSSPSPGGTAAPEPPDGPFVVPS